MAVHPVFGAVRRQLVSVEREPHGDPELGDLADGHPRPPLLVGVQEVLDPLTPSTVRAMPEWAGQHPRPGEDGLDPSDAVVVDPDLGVVHPAGERPRPIEGWWSSSSTMA